MAGVGACAHTPNLPLRPDPAPPPGSTTDVFEGRDGTKLLWREWPATGEVKGALVIVHGLKDYSARYARLASRAAAAGFDVYAYDLRGHGRSAGPRVAPDDWNDYVDDTERFLGIVEARERGKPVFLFGHSMGGAIAARTAEVHAPKVAGLILSGAALAIDAPPLLIAATRMTGFLLAMAPALKLSNGDFSSDPANEAAMDRDPMIEQGGAPARTAAGLVEGMHEIWRDVDRLTMPVLAMHGTADKLTAPYGSQALVDRQHGNGRFIAFDGYAHDLLHEPGDRGAHVEDRVLRFLQGAADDAPASRAELAGTPHGWTQSVELAGGVTHNSDTRSLGELTVDVARPEPLGWSGTLAARISNDVGWVTLRPLGIAVRAGPLAVGANGGGSLVFGSGATQLLWSVGGWADLATPLAHLRAFGEADFASGTRWIAGGTLRWPGDRTYWPSARAGVGPMISAGAIQLGGFPTTWFAVAGVQLYGAD